MEFDESKFTEKQMTKKDELINKHGLPITWYKIDGVIFFDYNFGTIGIEPDGYSHM